MYSIFIGYNIEICTMTKYILELELELEYASHHQIVVSFVLVVYSLYIAIFNVYTFHGYTLITKITHGGERKHNQR